MSWSTKIGRLGGVDIYLHWTFLLLLAWIFGSYVMAGAGYAAAAMGVAFIIAIFGCVVLHELGHATAAKAYGIETQDITILPIGGVARLGRIPEKPLQEFVIAAAGPFVNVIIAMALGALILGMAGTGNLMFGQILSGHFLQNLMWTNIVLVLFNLIPAFPMDGGRMLRAGLASVMDYVAATQIAAGVGQLLAIGFAIAGLFYFSNPLLVFVALFIYLGAGSEAQATQVRSLLRGVPVRQAMMTRIQTLSPDDSLRTAAMELLAGHQQDFPVVSGGMLVGMLRRSDLAEGLQATAVQRRVADVMTRDCPTVGAYELLDSVMEKMRETQCESLPVIHDGQLVGLVDMENIGELMMIRSAVRPMGKDPQRTVNAWAPARSLGSRQAV